ncbi:hypothetical protein [Streptomyces antimycoticus]|uniref:hypothetical protein n=1 Tax=Streptomyces antimycoticus TaxID=68175 RepID=UPI0038653E35|nr:hypothetical protein OG751_23140 [Streptomyces antimycoticus]
MKYFIILGLLVLTLALSPKLVLAAFTVVGVVAIWLATQPVLVAFGLGLLADRMRRWST